MVDVVAVELNIIVGIPSVWEFEVDICSGALDVELDCPVTYVVGSFVWTYDVGLSVAVEELLVVEISSKFVVDTMTVVVMDIFSGNPSEEEEVDVLPIEVDVMGTCDVDSLMIIFISSITSLRTLTSFSASCTCCWVKVTSV